MKNKTDIINEMHKNATADASKDQLTAIVTRTFSVIASMMAAGEEVNVADFGKFSATSRDERMGRNPATGAEVVIPASKAAKFKAAKGLKDALNA